MLTALFLLQATSSALPQATPIDPRSWVTSNDYPFEAMKNGEEGPVEYEVKVDQEGRPTDCRIIVSSGHESLDTVTCNIVSARGRFQPALGPDGKPVASSYKGKMTWRGGGKMGETWQATILDLRDRRHPKCTEQKRGGADPIPEQSCAYILHKKEILDQLGRQFTTAVSLSAMSDGSSPLFQGDPSWGQRLSYIADDQYYLGGSFPVSCETIAAEGALAGRDACEGMTNNRQLSDDERKRAKKLRSEYSTFGVPRRQ